MLKIKYDHIKLEILHKLSCRGFKNFDDLNSDYRTINMVSFQGNTFGHINLSREEINYLVLNAKYNHQDIVGRNLLMAATLCNFEENLNLTNQQLTHLIINTDLNRTDNFGYTPLMIMLSFKDFQKLKLSFDNFKYLIQNSPEIDRTSFSYINHHTSIALEKYFSFKEKFILEDNIKHIQNIKTVIKV